MAYSCLSKNYFLEFVAGGLNHWHCGNRDMIFLVIEEEDFTCHLLPPINFFLKVMVCSAH